MSSVAVVVSERLARYGFGDGHPFGPDRLAAFVRRRDIEKNELVGPFVLVVRGELDRVAGVTELDEADTLDDAAGVDVEARDDPLQVHSAASASASVKRRS